MTAHLSVVETEPLPGDEIRAFVERLEANTAQKRDLSEERKEILAEAKGRGYDPAILAKIEKLRARDRDDLAEEEAVLSMYLSALGMA